MKYFWLTVKHKLFVFRAGLKIGVPLWRLIIHDWTKFLPCELPHYQRQFFGAADDPLGFISAWIHHQNHNPHHWEYWIPRSGHFKCDPPYENNKPIPMPDWAIREMIADWMGASRAYNGKWPHGSEWEWWDKNAMKIQGNVHPSTWDRICEIVCENVPYVILPPKVQSIHGDLK